MDINCTLIIQCFNFGLAYVVLNHFVFKPVLACIMEERARHEQLENAITHSQEIIDGLELKRSRAWEHAQGDFKSYLMAIPYSYKRTSFALNYDYHSPTDAQIDAQAQRMHDLIMKKVSDDFK